MSIAAPPVPPGWSDTESALSSSSGSAQLTSVKHEPHSMLKAADVVSVTDRVLQLHSLIAQHEPDMTPAAHTAANDAAATTAAHKAANDATATSAADNLTATSAAMEESRLKSVRDEADTAAEKAAARAAAMEEVRLKSAKDAADAAAKKDGCPLTVLVKSKPGEVPATMPGSNVTGTGTFIGLPGEGKGEGITPED